MDWYFVGRLVGALLWPGVIAGLIYGVGWVWAAARAQRSPVAANGIRGWFRIAATASFAAVLLVTGWDFLIYSGVL